MSLLRRKKKSPIDQVFAACRKEKRSAFIPFLVGGDPDIERSRALILALAEGGADIIELGVPFSDPIADGPTNQRAAFRALEAGTTLDALLQMTKGLKTEIATPIVLFTYYNPIHAMGPETFSERAAECGVDGVLCVDLPPDEAADELLPALRDKGIDSVFLLAPTSTRDRIKSVSQQSTGFVYYVSRSGVTGSQDGLREALVRDVRKLRKRVGLPLAVGFGIATPEQVAEVGAEADGVVVGSELVRLIERHGDDSDLAVRMRDRVAELSAPLRA